MKPAAQPELHCLSRPQDESASNLLFAVIAAALAVLSLASLALWSRYGVTIYIDQLAGAVWNCF